MSTRRVTLSSWRSGLSTTPQALFKWLGQRLLAGALGDLEDVGGQLLSWEAAVGLDAEGQAGRLVGRALARALAEVLIPHQAWFRGLDQQRWDALVADILARLQTVPFELDGQFMSKPDELDLVEVVVRWLGRLDLHGVEVVELERSFRGSFIAAVTDEVREHPASYMKVLRALEGDLAAAGAPSRGWDHHNQALARAVETPELGLEVALAQVFVRPLAYVVRNGSDELGPERRDVDQVFAMLDTWLASGQRGDPARLVCGGPGLGKTALARMYALHCIARGTRVLLLSVAELRFDGDVGRCIERCCEARAGLPSIKLGGEEAGREPLLLILDGLERLGARAGSFVDDLGRLLSRVNDVELRLRALILGRTVSAQRVERRLPGTSEVLHLLPFFVPERARAGAEWRDERGMLGHDLRRDWWQNYVAATGSQAPEFPAALADDALLEVTCHPFLATALAGLYQDARHEGLRPTSADVYARLVVRVFERERGGAHPGVASLGLRDFRRLLELAAVAGWHNQGRVPVDVFRDQRVAGELIRDDQILGLVGAMHLDRHEVEGEGYYEFQHQALADYLVVSHVVSRIIELSSALETDADGPYARLDAMLSWLELCGPAPLELGMLSYVGEELSRRAGQDMARVERWQRSFVGLVEHVLWRGSPCERIEPRLRHREARRWARNAEAALLVVLAGCAGVCGRHSSVRWPRPDAFGAWFRGLQGQPIDGVAHRSVIGQCLSWLDLSGQELSGIDLAHANLCHADLSEAQLSYATLVGARAEHARFDGAQLRHANMGLCRLADASFVGANLNRANFTHALLDRADVTRAHFDRAFVVGASTRDVDWTTASTLGTWLEPST